MDNTVRSNTKCIIGNPRCDVVFASTRTCFIAYGFERSAIEVEVVKEILKQYMVKGEEAGGTLTPGHFAFCTKICSQIISSQFCIVFLNHDIIDGQSAPNANVNMEYGLMLGFNKYIIPFQKEDEALPFNVSTLDTVKYNTTNFRAKAEKVIAQAIEACQIHQQDQILTNEAIHRFLISKGLLFAPQDAIGEKNLSRLGEPLNFMLFNNFSGDQITYVGVFTNLTPDDVAWRINKLTEIIQARLSDLILQNKLRIGLVTAREVALIKDILGTLKVLVIVNHADIVAELMKNERLFSAPFSLELYSMDDVKNV